MTETDIERIPISAIAAERGIKSCADFANFFAALMADVVSQRIEPQVAKAACQCGDQILRMAKLQIVQSESVSGDSDPISAIQISRLLSARQ